LIVVWRIQILFVLFSVFMFCASALAQEGMWSTPWVSNVRCNRQDADKAEYEALKTWATVYSAFKRYGQCDEGAIAEGYSASVATLLASHWSTVRELWQLTKKDPMFERFVLYHVDGTMEMDQQKAIIANARDNCPPGVERLCKCLEKAAKHP
jgi:hypothetical protein